MTKFLVIDLNKLNVNRFEAKFEKSTVEDCWNWNAGKYKGGYGMFGIAGVPFVASRIAYALYVGTASLTELDVLHTCDNPACVNPSHLFLGTHQDNMDDMTTKGRQATGSKSGSRKYPERRPKGESHYKAKLSENDVREIRKRISEGTKGIDLANEYKVSFRTISEIKRNKRWTHLLN